MISKSESIYPLLNSPENLYSRSEINLDFSKHQLCDVIAFERFKDVIPQLSNLESLSMNLKDFELTPSDCAQLGNLLPVLPKLRELRLKNFLIGLNNINKFKELMLNLHKISNLTGFHFINKHYEINPEIIYILCKATERMNKLEKFSFQCTSFKEHNLAYEINYLIKTVAKHPTLQALNLKILKLDRSAFFFPTLKTHLKEAKHMKYLNLDIREFYAIRKNDLGFVIQLLKSLPCLETLILSLGEFYYQEIAEVLLDFMSHLLSMTSIREISVNLNVHGEEFSPELKSQVEKLLEPYNNWEPRPKFEISMRKSRYMIWEQGNNRITFKGKLNLENEDEE